jgi:hypothetical protein
MWKSQRIAQYTHTSAKVNVPEYKWRQQKQQIQDATVAHGCKPFFAASETPRKM